MVASRRRVRLPSLDALRVFEVTARHLSFTKAAAELNVTQSAISHRIRCLEQSLGQRLLRRGASGLELTPAGAALARGVGRGVEEMWSAVETVDSQCSGKTLTLSVHPAFARHWLTPRLPRFVARFPSVELTISADDQLADLTFGNVDARIEFSVGGDRRLDTTCLMPDRIVPVCSPAALKRFGPLRTPADVAKFPLLFDRTVEQDASGSGWQAWLEAAGVPELECRGGMRFNDASLVLNAAAAGLGLAIMRASLLGNELRTGRLVCPLPQTVPTLYAYHFVSMPERRDDPKLRGFLAWLMEEAKASCADDETLASAGAGSAAPAEAPSVVQVMAIAGRPRGVSNHARAGRAAAAPELARVS